MPAAARAVGVSKAAGYAWLAEAGGVRPRVMNPELAAVVTAGSGVLSFADRCRIEELVRAGHSPSAIAGLLGRHRGNYREGPACRDGRH